MYQPERHGLNTANTPSILRASPPIWIHTHTAYIKKRMNGCKCLHGIRWCGHILLQLTWDTDICSHIPYPYLRVVSFLWQVAHNLEHCILPRCGTFGIFESLSCTPCLRGLPGNTAIYTNWSGNLGAGTISTVLWGFMRSITLACKISNMKVATQQLFIHISR